MIVDEFKGPDMQAISKFLWSIGIEVHSKQLDEKTFLPGIRIVNGTIWVDEDKMLSSGDVLHEAGHLAVMDAHLRDNITDNVVHDESQKGGEEMAAIAWSWAAALHLGIDPQIVFHDKGYHGASDSIVENFSEGRYFGVPILQWKGMTVEARMAQPGQVPFPHMMKWLA